MTTTNRKIHQASKLELKMISSTANQYLRQI